MAYILFRGEYDKRRDPVQASTPDVLPAMPEGVPNDRLGFARWWDGLHPRPGTQWADDPAVWVVEFRVLPASG